MFRNHPEQPTSIDCRTAQIRPSHCSVPRMMMPALTALLLSLPLPTLGRTDLIWFENFQWYNSPIDSANSPVYQWSVHRDDGSIIGGGEGVVAEHAFLGRDWDRGMGYIHMIGQAPLETPWIVKSLSFDWYVPNLDSATHLTVEWSADFELHGSGVGGWQSLFSAEYEPGSGVHREVIDFTSQSAGRFLIFPLRFIPSGGNGETGFAVQDLGQGLAVFGQAPEPAAPSRVMAAGLMLWLITKARARCRRSATPEP